MSSEKATAQRAQTPEKGFFAVLCVRRSCFSALFSGLMMISCARPPASAPRARNLLLITVDTLRADHVGAYGWTRARTPALDRLAREGIVFDRAYAAAPITLPSHASMLTGRYPPGHGSRDNGIRLADAVPTLATELHAHGFATAAFVAAFPLDHQFGLNRGFDLYSDRLGHEPDGRPANERPASQVIDEAIAWLRSPGPKGPARPAPPARPFFLWVHLFEPHAPYGRADTGRPVLDRYDDEIATADREIGRLLDALGPAADETLIVAAGDHGEAFGEHGEFAHSIFVYDTTLRVPLILCFPAASSGRGSVPRGLRVADPVSLVDIAPTVMRALGGEMKDADGLDLAPAFGGSPLPRRELYAESFAPLVEFGWAPLRALRAGPWKYIAAPRPELYNMENDAGERIDLAAAQAAVVQGLDQRVGRYAGAALPKSFAPTADPQAAERLRALGYSTGAPSDTGGPRPDPKDRREMAARIAQVTSGELAGAALISALEGIVRDDPRNGQAHLRLGHARLQAGDCARGEPELERAIASGLPSADAYLGLVTCRGRRHDLAGAERALTEAQRLEPANPVVTANVGILRAAKGDLPGAIDALTSALAADPNLHEARFNLAIAYAKSGRKAEAAAAARELLSRLPASAPERPEVGRLLRSLQ
jgi:arylsulfatase A-like enzyme/cytochrome c-type biogenesis protein CcmH/NrfG